MFALCFLTVSLTGGLGAPTPGGFITFDEIRREHFTALTVHRSYGPPSSDPLLVHVHLLGDGADADLSAVRAYLRSRLHVILVEDPEGAPVFLTRQNLIATSGAGALGATIKGGIAAEVGTPSLTGCVVAHEIAHFLGLHHVGDAANLMAPRCAAEKLRTAVLEESQRGDVARLQSITAVTTRGIATWATR